jgi:prophage antirepressor-like protein
MSNLQLFNFQNKEVRVVQLNNEPWFVAVDVFKALDIVWKGADKLETIPEHWKCQYLAAGTK